MLYPPLIERELRELQDLVEDESAPLQRTAERLAGFLRWIKTRRTPLYQEARQKRLDMRNTLRHRMRQPMGPSPLIFRERKCLKNLVVVVDASESMYLYERWLAVVLAALTSLAPGLPVFLFGADIASLDSQDGLAGIRRALRRARQKRSSRPQLTLAALPGILETVQRFSAGTRYLLLFSDLVLSPRSPDELPVAAVNQQLNAYQAAWLLDPFSMRLDESGSASLSGTDMLAFLEKHSPDRELGFRGVESDISYTLSSSLRAQLRERGHAPAARIRRFPQSQLDELRLGVYHRATLKDFLTVLETIYAGVDPQ